eukprot:comp20697_c0_seq1/m.42436 comp20697_c0_seq1/g.42436  ORF comp20697_c0_seq1/g.42436 comp20697_c0_seq1/m.42436 type:complete len:290 (+) comp20697_c0_seq1:100-969(+)
MALEAFDQQLFLRDLERVSVERDASSLFRAVSVHLFQTQLRHDHVRAECVRFLSAHSAEFAPFYISDDGSSANSSFAGHIERLRTGGIPSGLIELQALARQFALDLIVLSPEGAPIEVHGGPTRVVLCVIDGRHYDLAVPRSSALKSGGNQSKSNGTQQQGQKKKKNAAPEDSDLSSPPLGRGGGGGGGADGGADGGNETTTDGLREGGADGGAGGGGAAAGAGGAAIAEGLRDGFFSGSISLSGIRAEESDSPASVVAPSSPRSACGVDPSLRLSAAAPASLVGSLTR